LKILTTILLFTVIFLQTFSLFVIQADYFLNKDYVTKAYCVNKDKPAMHCNGKCYLARQLKEQEKQDQQAPNPKKEKFEIQPFFLPEQFIFEKIQFSTKVKYHYTEELIRLAFLRSVFHPPAI